jgi:hypothetical protein
MATDHIEAAVDIAAAWARMLIGLRDLQLQVGWLRERLAQLGAARAADVLTIVLARAEQREERYAVLLLRVSLALDTPELEPLKRAVASIARVRDQRELARFLSAEPAEAADPSEGDPEAISVSQPPRAEPKPAIDFSKGGRPLSLGERKSLARKRDRDLLARVLRDPHPDVVRIVLDNPAITELDVIRLCARRPIASEVLLQVFRHPRWIVRYRVRLTLALNPYTPEPVTLQLLPHLTASDLREVQRSGDMSERVRAACSAGDKGVLH